MKEKSEQKKRVDSYIENVFVALNGLAEEMEKTKEALKKWMQVELKIHDVEYEEEDDNKSFAYCNRDKRGCKKSCE